LLSKNALFSSVALSSNGKIVAFGNKTGNITLCDATTGKELKSLEGHAGTTIRMRFSPDDRLLASCGADNRLKLWDVTDGELVRSWSAAVRGLAPMAFAPDGRLLAASVDKSVRLWDILSREGPEHPEGVRLGEGAGGYDFLAFSPDAKRLATFCSEARMGQTGGIRLWDVQTGQHVFAFPDTKTGYRLAFSPDGRRLAAGPAYLLGGPLFGNQPTRLPILIWDTTGASVDPP
jgi:WD40 repeat protein